MIIREAAADDRRWAAALMAASEPWITLGRTYEICLRNCQSALDEIHVAWVGAERCGFTLVRERGVAGAPYLVSIAVADAWRSRGIGAELLAAFERRFTGRYRHVFLCVSSFNPRARALYERHGYRVVGVLDDFIIDGADEILMAKRLPAAGR